MPSLDLKNAMQFSKWILVNNKKKIKKTVWIFSPE